jgi:hypothetical protein
MSVHVYISQVGWMANEAIAMCCTRVETLIDEANFNAMLDTVPKHM